MFVLSEAIEILAKTPKLLDQFLGDLSENWIFKNEGDETWNPYDIVAHFIHGESDWIERANYIIEENPEPFLPANIHERIESTKGKTIKELLEKFKKLRIKNIQLLKKMNISEKDLIKTGAHPAFGKVTLRQLLSTWVVHDLGHIRQIMRVMAKRYSEEVGPWSEYLRVLQE